MLRCLVYITMQCTRILKLVTKIFLCKLLVIAIICGISRHSISFKSAFYKRSAPSNQILEDTSTLNEFNIFDDEATRVSINALGLPWWEGGGCNSTVDTFSMTSDIKGHCGYRSSLLGKGQKVITFSLYGNYTEYATGLSIILNSTALLYPGWTARLYTEPRVYKEQLCPLLEKYQHFYVCDVHNLPGPFPNVNDVNPSLWRVAPIGDELVDVFLSRDIDAELLHREVAAVSSFLDEGSASLHVMRDHPDHKAPVLAGMFGVRQTDGNRALLSDIRAMVFRTGQRKYSDQAILANYLFSRLRTSSIQHDSYTCLQYPGSEAFPTRRLDGRFVGNRVYRQKYRNDLLKKPCPKHCRPQDHQDWVNC